MQLQPSYSFNLKNKVIFVTGAAGQLGRHLVTAFLQQNAKVIAVDTTLAALQNIAREERWSNSDTLLTTCNIQCLSEVQSAFCAGIHAFSTGFQNID